MSAWGLWGDPKNVCVRVQASSTRQEVDDKKKRKKKGAKGQTAEKEKNYIKCSSLLSHRVEERNERVPELQRYLLPLATAVDP